MHNISLKSCLACVLLTMSFIIGCEEPPPGFGILARVQTGPSGYVQYHPNLVGMHIKDLSPVTGTVYAFGGGPMNPLSTAPFYVADGRCVAEWIIAAPGPPGNPPITPCAGSPPDTGVISCKRYNVVRCSFGGMFLPRVRVIPDNLMANSYSNITIEANGISEAYGMPKVFVYNEAGLLGGEATASSCGVNSQGVPWMNGTIWLPSMPTGYYTLIVSNRTASGTYVDIGGIEFTVDGGQPVCDPGEAADCSAIGGIYNYSTCHCDCACG